MKYTVSPLTCGRCVGRITEAPQAIDSGANIHVDLAAGTADADGFFEAGMVASTLAEGRLSGVRKDRSHPKPKPAPFALENADERAVAQGPGLTWISE